MLIESFEKLIGWDVVRRTCFRTINKDSVGNEPTSYWKRKILLAEHSPIRCLTFVWTWRDIYHWVQVHLVRHHEGCEKFVGTQRSDRTGIDRTELSQSALQDMDMLANAQALINISRKRLCNCASPETRQAWQLVKDKVAETEPELASCMVKDCIYRGHCYEMKSCGYHKTQSFKEELESYRKEINK